MDSKLCIEWAWCLQSAPMGISVLKIQKKGGDLARGKKMANVWGSK